MASSPRNRVATLVHFIALMWFSAGPSLAQPLPSFSLASGRLLLPVVEVDESLAFHAVLERLQESGRFRLVSAEPVAGGGGGAHFSTITGVLDIPELEVDFDAAARFHARLSLSDPEEFIFTVSEVIPLEVGEEGAGESAAEEASTEGGPAADSQIPPIAPPAAAEEGADDLGQSTGVTEVVPTAEPPIGEPSVEPGFHVVSGRVDGLTPGGSGRVTLSSNGILRSVALSADGGFRFDEVPAGDYVVKVAAEGYATEPARRITAGSGVEPRFTVEALPADPYRFHWEEDVSVSGAEYSSYINEPLSVELSGEPVESADGAAAERLLHDYHIVLSDEGQPWSAEHAYRLLEALRAIPQPTRDFYAAQELPPSRWVLSDENLADDLVVDAAGTVPLVRVSSAAFTYAEPLLATVEGRRGLFYSKRLHRAAVRWVTGNGTDLDAVERILTERFGVTTRVPDYAALTAPTTGEGAERFQSFHPEELIDIINAFEEMPRGMHAVDGLNYLVRRLDGTPHPLYATAPAVAWATVEDGYIEFMDSAFTGDTCCQYLQRLIIHEKAHFLWHKLFDTTLRADWIALGGWYENPDDPHGWSTSDTTGFVSAYAHGENPDEDMAESIAAFVINPDLLRSRSQPKYEFIRDRVMQGSIYLSRIREDLTFEVYNLFPDYVYPGKIRRVDVSVAGAADEEKEVTVEIELHAFDHVMEGAQRAYLRLFSEIGTFEDLYLYPIDANGARTGLGTVLRGRLTLDRSAKGGYWRTDQIAVTDAVGNRRTEGVDDFGFRMYVNNPQEDLIPPRYVEGSFSLTLAADQVLDGRTVQRVTAAWTVDENNAMRTSWPCYASLRHDDGSSYALEAYGRFDAESSRCAVEFILTDFMAPGGYVTPYINMIDAAENQQGVYLDDRIAPERRLEVTTAGLDAAAPELDLNRITISAEPTHPEAPNGETLVSIVYYARDDASGVGSVSYSLRDPQGVNHFGYHYHDNFYTTWFEGDPTAWGRYELSVVLPVGSAPGTWGLSSMSLRDKAGRFHTYDFTEILHFDVLQ